MFKETLGAAVLGVTLASVPGAATATAEGAAAAPSASPAAAATAAARRERLFVDIDTERVWRRRGHIEIKVSEADSRRRVRGVLACLHTKRWGRGGWDSLGCERTDWRGEADWYVDLHRRSVYQIRIHRTWRYHSYRSDWFRVLDRGGWDNGRDRDRDNGWDNGRDNGRDGDRRR